MLIDQFGTEIVSRETENDEDTNKEIRKQYLADKGNYDEWAGLSYAVHPSSLGRLNSSLLRDLYSRSSAIRPAVDSISREISTLPWTIINKDYKYHNPKELKPISYFLSHPNLDNETFSSLIARYINDLLVVGKGTIEKTRNVFGELKELMPRDATLYTPQINQYGFIVNYIEYKKDTTTIARYHKKDDIIFQHFTPNTHTLGAVPIIETIIDEVALLMLAIKSIAWSFTRDEIPPGVLHLGLIGEVALNRAKASFEAGKGLAGKGKLRVIDNVDNVKWVQFTRTHQEMQVAELIPMIERIVFRNFGLSPVESSQTDISRQVADTSYKSSQSKMVSPVMVMIAEAINLNVIEEFDEEAEFIFNRNSQESFNDQSKGLADLADRGMISTNEARLKIGFPPVEGGDKRSYRLGNDVAMIDEKTGEPIYREPAPVAKPVVKKDILLIDDN
jgi:HK97 family phage portal protein